MRRSVALVLSLAFAAVVLAALPAGAAVAATDTPAVAIAGTGVTLHLEGGTEKHATGSVTVSNDSASPVTVTVTGWFPNGDTVSSSGNQTVPAHSTQALSFAFDLPKVSDTNGQLAVSATDGATAFTPLTVSRTPTVDEVWIVIGIGGVLGFLALLVGLMCGGGQLVKKVGAGAQWSFTSSWAQNITSLAAVLTTVLAASGFLSSVLQGIDTADFVGLNLLAAGAVAVAPLVMYNEPKGWRFVIAAAMTTFGAGVVLSTLGVMTLYSVGDNSQRNFVIGLLALAGLVLCAYVEETMRSTLSGTPQPATHTPRKSRRSGVVPDSEGLATAGTKQELFVNLI